MNGNSQLAMNQWYIASECPPHLAAIAPWEGVSDLYNDNMAQGGIPFPEFSQMINASYRGGWQTDDGEAIKMYPCWNEFWQDRVAKVENIKIPVYVTVGYQHSYHVRGSLRAWRFMKSKRKWLRMHRVFEWEDLNTPANMNDLKLFFDRYLKGIYNGWELTPAVRMDVMDGYNFDYQLARAENEFPLKRTQYTPFYLDASDMSMSREPVQTVAKASYEATEGSCHFDFPFEEDTELSGYMKLRLWVEADGSNDMDLMIWVMKADAEGNEVPTTAFYNDPVPGTQGFLRVSHRELDEKQSTEWSPVPSHRTEELLEPGQIVPVEIEIWPTCRMWHKGERLRVNIAGHYVRDESWFAPGPRSDRNAGQHIIHTGGEYDSYLLAPVIPPKYQVGDYKFPR